MALTRSNGIQDAGVPLVVDPFTRMVTVPSTERVIGVVGDHCSEQVRFKLPRRIDNHDMLSSSVHYVAWQNVDGEPGDDELVVVESTEDYILFGWTIRNRLAAAKGLVSFSLHFECFDEKTGTRIYSWGTHTCTACEILDSLNKPLGAYEAIYINGDALVFADYTPVVGEELDLTSCVIPKDTVELSTEGVHDVGKYAYAEIKWNYETPSITIANGKVEASAHGLTATEDLEAPQITFDGSWVKVEANGLTATEQIHLQNQLIVGTFQIFGADKVQRIRYQIPVGGARIDYEEFDRTKGQEIPETLEVFMGALIEVEHHARASVEVYPGTFLNSFTTTQGNGVTQVKMPYPTGTVGIEIN